jgi:colanic acid biosynthesis glycosyl transferase WcaI
VEEDERHMSGQKKLWIVSELYYPEMTSTGYILTQLAEGLTTDYDIHVLCGQPTYSARGVRAPDVEKRNGVVIKRCMGATLNKNVFFLKLINFFTLSISLFANALVSFKRNDIVLVVTNPPILPFFILLACRIRGAKCSLLIHDIYPDILVATGIVKNNSIIIKYYSAFSNLLYRSMICIFVIGRDMKNLISERNNNCRDNIFIATNWADLQLVKPEPRGTNNLIKELGIKDKFIVLCAGNMGYPNDIESIVLAADLLKGNEEIIFLFLGDGVKKSWLENYVKIKKLKNIIILSSKPRSEQSDFLNACDIAIISLTKNMKGLSVPSRLYNTLASGKPIIAVTEELSELSLVVEEERIGWVVPPGDPHEISRAIKEAMMDRNGLDDMAKRSRKVAELKYSFHNILNIYRDTFKYFHGC